MSLYRAIATLALAIPTAAQAQPASPRMAGTLHVQNFCSAVQHEVPELEPKHDSVAYQYETLLYDAAGVVRSDSEAAIATKVRAFFDRHGREVTCDFVNFTPRFGNILKLAVIRQTDSFVYRALDQWKIGINQVDRADGETVLDYIVRKRTEAGSNQVLVRIYQKYYDRFRAAGAKLRSELEAAGSGPSIATGVAQEVARLSALADGGDFEAALRLYNAYDDGRTTKIFGQSLPRDTAAAARWLARGEQIARTSKRARDPYWIGNVYLAKNDPARSVEWFERAAALGDRNAMYELGLLYANGKGVARDLPRALTWMERADGQDLGGSSMVWLGSINGWLGRRDAQIGWYRLAWQQGLHSHMVPGFDYATGPGRFPLQEWFRVNGIDKCGTTIKGDKSC